VVDRGHRGVVAVEKSGVPSSFSSLSRVGTRVVDRLHGGSGAAERRAVEELAAR
jgi:hypothetical protein